jgi:hypothetical protein
MTARSDFQKYLSFDLSLAELRARVGPTWHFEREGHSFELQGCVAINSPLEVDFAHVNNAIALALQDSIPPGALEEWANLLLMSDAYAIAPHRDKDQRETLLQCIHELASPSMFGTLERERLVEIKAKCQA